MAEEYFDDYTVLPDAQDGLPSPHLPLQQGFHVYVDYAEALWRMMEAKRVGNSEQEKHYDAVTGEKENELLELLNVQPNWRRGVPSSEEVAALQIMLARAEEDLGSDFQLGKGKVINGKPDGGFNAWHSQMISHLVNPEDGLTRSLSSELYQKTRNLLGQESDSQYDVTSQPEEVKDQQRFSLVHGASTLFGLAEAANRIAIKRQTVIKQRK